MSEPVTIADNVLVLEGAVNTGVLLSGHEACLIDCCDSVTPERLAALGIRSVAWIFCTQHRRPNVAGARPFMEKGARLAVPSGERRLFEQVEAFWEDPANRWRPAEKIPPGQVLPDSLPVSRAMREGDSLDWEGMQIRAIETPGATQGSISYVVKAGEATILFAGDCLCGPGRIPDLYSLQKSQTALWDYHCFLGSRTKLLPSLERLEREKASILVPSRGPAMEHPADGIRQTRDRLHELWRNYTAISAVNFYFPDCHADTLRDPLRMKPAPQFPMPDYIQRIPNSTSFVIIAPNRSALLVDAGQPEVITTLQEWIRSGRIRQVDLCWITHYHYDHVDALGDFQRAFRCPIAADEHMADILEHPLHYYLPCISPTAVAPVRRTRHGETWTWKDFTLTALHLPGQTCHDGGLLLEKNGTRILLCGDSFAPAGLDDYCAPNRNFLRPGHGYHRCIDILRQYAPDLIVNQHQELPFRFDEDALAYMEDMLDKRRDILAELLPWDAPDFGVDEHWCRTFPYEQATRPGQRVIIRVLFTNHGSAPSNAAVEPVLPEGWTWDQTGGSASASLPPETSGFADFGPVPDRAASASLCIPEDLTPRLYVIPFRITWNGRYLGQFRHALVRVLPATC